MTLEQRVARLERSCFFWRGSFLAVVLGAIGLGAARTNPSSRGSDLGDGAFSRVTVKELIVQNEPRGPSIHLSVNKEQAALQVATGGAASSAALVANQGEVNLFLTRRQGGAITSAGLNVDEKSGSLSLKDAKGNFKDVEPE
ncbi:MAG: hypothetical protein M3O30_14740 [Planctomycetota bacterium]|nr:hypothetical protein [Planctomycetota bacterium]